MMCFGGADYLQQSPERRRLSQPVLVEGVSLRGGDSRRCDAALCDDGANAADVSALLGARLWTELEIKRMHATALVEFREHHHRVSGMEGSLILGIDLSRFDVDNSGTSVFGEHKSTVFFSQNSL
ncbi:hypothetical protein F1559_001489 [Cyanidiococcus yangmingshanensis]|uniref:Uncharacterized protein n=1 Tax=Cyanidiococcus yangmingshanensis TaxID=2690220 RepID=A0A7J7IMQ6_9RHOD|nr:hypothetical protein F1559_001489 [Cyanidiococcus yangmingshanensis]